MVETLHPGLYFVEENNPPTVPGLSTSYGGFAGFAGWGNEEKASAVTSWEQFKYYYGGFCYNPSDNPAALPIDVYNYFNNGGRIAYIGRCLEATAAQSSIQTDDCAHGTPDQPLTIKGKYKGTLGDRLSASSLKFETTLAAQLATGATTATLTTVSGLEEGDVVVIDPAAGANSVTVVVAAIDYSTNIIIFKATVFAGGNKAIGTSVYCGSRHKASSTTVTAIAAGDSTVTVTDATDFIVGQIITVTTLTTGIDIVGLTVTGKSGNQLSFTPVCPALVGADIPVGSPINSQEFNFKVYLDDEFVEEYQYLSMSTTNATDYIETRLSGTNNPSNYITLQDDTSTSAVYERMPGPWQTWYLASGSDGAALTSSELLGAAGVPPSGMHLFDAVPELNFFCLSSNELTAADNITAMQGGIAYAEDRADLSFIVTTPDPTLAVGNAAETPANVKNFRLYDLARNSSYATLYWPWLEMDNPIVATAVINQPPNGFVMGTWAKKAYEEGPHVTPANVELRGIKGLTYNCTNTEQDLLNPLGINVLRFFRGRGYRVWGGRTLNKLMDGNQWIVARNMKNLTKRSIEEVGTEWVFAPNDEELWDLITTTLTELFTRWWEDGWLRPRDNIAKAFYVKCDSETNPPSVTNLGQCVIKCAINPPPPAEKLVFYLGLLGSGAVVEL